MIETTAITIGTKARNDANTKVSTSSAPNAADQRLDQHARALAVGAAVLDQGVEPGQVHGRAPTVTPASAALAAFSASRVLAELRVGVRRRVDDREGGAPVLGDEGAVAGRGVGGDRAPGQRLLQAASRLPPVRAHAAGVDRFPSGSLTTGSSGDVSPPVPL